jgi:hypothetical protein
MSDEFLDEMEMVSRARIAFREAREVHEAIRRLPITAHNVRLYQRSDYRLREAWDDLVWHGLPDEMKTLVLG